MSIPTSGSLHPTPADATGHEPRIEFARELAARPDRRAIVARLRAGHDADARGWCRHGAHAHHWERHPCAVIGLADLVDAAAPECAADRRSRP